LINYVLSTYFTSVYISKMQRIEIGKTMFKLTPVKYLKRLTNRLKIECVINTFATEDRIVPVIYIVAYT